MQSEPTAWNVTGSLIGGSVPEESEDNDRFASGANDQALECHTADEERELGAFLDGPDDLNAFPNGPDELDVFPNKPGELDTSPNGPG